MAGMESGEVEFDEGPLEPSRASGRLAGRGLAEAGGAEGGWQRLGGEKGVKRAGGGGVVPVIRRTKSIALLILASR